MHPILHKSAQKIKPFQNHILLCSTIGLLCICSFSLGYIYHAYSQKARNATNIGLRIEYPPYVTNLMKDGPYRPISSIVQGSRVTTGQNGQGVGEAGQLDQNLVSTAGNFAASNSGRFTILPTAKLCLEYTKRIASTFRRQPKPRN